MASRKLLKKQINTITEIVFTDFISFYSEDQINEIRLEELVSELIAINSDFRSRISHTEKGSVKLFYKKLRSDFSSSIDGLYQKMQQA